MYIRKTINYKKLNDFYQSMKHKSGNKLGCNSPESPLMILLTISTTLKYGLPVWLYDRECVVFICQFVKLSYYLI